MAKTTLYFAAVFLVQGAVVYLGTGRNSITALIPAVFGLLLGALGLLAQSDDSKRRMFVMHLAATLGLLGFLYPGVDVALAVVRHMHGQRPLHPRTMVEDEMVLSLLCLVYVLLCVRSFVAVRRTRAAEQ